MTNEPVALSVAIGTVLATAVAFAAVLWPDKLTPEVTAGVIALGNALIGLGVALYARSKVTPV